MSNTTFPDPFQPPPGTVIEVDHHTVTLQHKRQNDTTLYRWQRNDGVWMSPEFTNVTEAIQYPATKGFKIEVVDPSQPPDGEVGR